MPMIAASALLFTIGRITFLYGYPRGAGARSFGMAVTALPNLVAFGLASGMVAVRMWT
ncbi:hypothetical protein GOC18_24410 [Sinorhizobium meliloti]|uniref:hypothetical protein n=1 Tax=Rhizobium meliloti TaxID=382 RepID=UPI00299E37E8|nr:hypothetical protein [Sinorhizobium meliloti]